ncbi:MAG: beta-lactamase family protein, partial [Planctomycetes bacterium]|nr:beta-lactamase family protein [Planctomycetota bacterium]
MGSLLAVCLLALPALPPQEVDAGAKPLDELLLRYAASGWSGSVLVARDGEVLLAGGYGFADFQADRANEAGTLFELGSITKSFTAAAVVKLAQQGKLTLDDSIAVHLPGVPQHSREITLRQLLTHTSGIPRGNAKGRGEDLAGAVVDYLGSGPEAIPGKKFEYWNGGYALLAGVIERASGRSYTQYLEEELFAPAGMSDTGFTGDSDLDATRAALGSSRDGRDRTALEHPYQDYGYQYRGMGGIVTSVLDLAKWERALATHALLDEAHTRTLFEPAKDGYALGWKIGRAVNGSLRQAHGGAVRGFVSEFRRYPAENACVAVLCNRDDQNPQEIADNLECLLFDRQLATPPPKGELLSRAEAGVIAGSYVGAAGKLVVRAAPGVL